MPPPIPPPHHLHLLRKPNSIPDLIFSAFSLLILFTTSPKPIALFFPPNPNNNNNRLSFLSTPRKFPKMSNPRNPNRGPSPSFATPQSLSDWLRPRLAAESFSSWGTPGTKNVHNLWLEIAEGETFLADSLPPVRTVEVVIVRIIRDDGKVLVESHQELSDGAIRQRGRPLSEKMKPGELVEAAVYRAVEEELGSLLKIAKNSDDSDSRVRIRPGSYVKKVEERASASYPGLPACYVLHTVDAEVDGLPEGEFCTEEVSEYGESKERSLADCAVSCKKHYWSWVDSYSI